MSSHIYDKDESLWMSNQRLSTLPPFAFKVGDAIAKTPGDTEFLRQLREWTETEWFNGYDLDLAGRFPTDTCRRSWATVFSRWRGESFCGRSATRKPPRGNRPRSATLI